MPASERRQRSPHGGHLAGLALAALGVVYGDIGTSPLYSLQECFHGDHGFPPTPENVFGVVSLVFWTLIVVVMATLLAAIVARAIWKWPLPVVVLVTCVFLIFDLAFFIANLTKFAAGGWFPLLAGAFVFCLMSSWRRGRNVLAAKVKAAPLEEFVADLDASAATRVEGTAVFLSRRRATPPALLLNLKHNHVLHRRVVLLTVLHADVPVLAPAERAEVEPLGKGFFRVVVRYGFLQYPGLEDMLDQVRRRGLDLDIDSTTFFVGREMLVPNRRHALHLWRERLFTLMARLALRPTEFLKMPCERVVELWEQVEI